MPQWNRIAVAVLCLLSAPGLAQGLGGSWEGLISDPSRPISFQARFESGDGGTGTFEMLGRKSPIERVEVSEGQVRIRVVSGELPIQFEGTLDGGRLSGTSTLGETSLPFSMEREPALPKPTNRDEAWRQDLEVAERKLMKLDRSFSPRARQEFARRMATLRASVEKKSDPELIVELARAVALGGNAHTRLYLLRNRTELRRYPLRVWWFKDGLFVVKATPEHAQVLGCQVTAIEGQAPERLRSKVAELYAGSTTWVDYMSAYTLTSPEVLYGLHLVPDLESATWSFACPTGKLTRKLTPLPLVRKTTPTEAWWDLSPRHSNGDVELVSALRGEVPLYLRHPDQHFWFEYLPDSQVLYLQYNRSENMPGESVSQFGERVRAALAQHPVKKLVVDLRFNTGGNKQLGSPLMRELQAASHDKQVFVLISRTTFSAAMYHVAEWKQWGKALLVGEPVGDALDYWAEGGNILLPNSGLTVHYANAFHGYSTRKYPEREPFHEDLDVATLAPDVLVLPTSREYLGGSDPLLDALIRWSPKPAQKTR